MPVPDNCTTALNASIAVTVDNITEDSLSSFTTGLPSDDSSGEDLTDLEWFYAISLYYYSLIALIVVLVVGSLLSFFTCCNRDKAIERKYLAPSVWFCAGEED